MRFFLVNNVIQEEGLYVYNIHNIVEKHLSTMLYVPRGVTRAKPGRVVSIVIWKK
jgi:hypothetical protein